MSDSKYRDALLMIAEWLDIDPSTPHPNEIAAEVTSLIDELRADRDAAVARAKEAELRLMGVREALDGLSDRTVNRWHTPTDRP